CSPTRTPAAAVSMALNCPPLGWPGFGSKVSVWLGPPLIQSRMQARLRSGLLTASRASAGSQLEPYTPTAPAASRKAARRDTSKAGRGVRKEDILGLLCFSSSNPWRRLLLVFNFELSALS